MLRLLPRLAYRLALFLAFYALIGFFILPGVALRIANQQLAQHATVPAQLERLEFNPFTLRLDLHGLRIGESATPQLAFEKLHADLEWSSLWRLTPHLALVRLTRPHTEVLLDPDGQLNLAQLFALPESTEEPPVEDEATEPFPLRIDRLVIEEGHVHFQDRQPGETVDVTYSPLNLELHNLHTRPGDAADAQLLAEGPAGGLIHWSGRLNLMPFQSSGRLEIRDLALSSFWPYAKEHLALELQSGILNAATDYQLDLSAGFHLLLRNARLRLAPFSVADPDGTPRLTLEHLDARQISLDLARRQLVIGELRSAGLETRASRDTEGDIDWLQLLTPASNETAATEPAAEADGAPWRILLADAQLRGYRAQLTDQAMGQPVELRVGPLDLDVREFDSTGATPFQLRLDTGLGEEGRIQADGHAGLQPLDGELQVRLEAVDLTVAQAYLTPHVRIELLGGQLAGDLQVGFRQEEALTLQVRGQAAVAGLHTRDTLRHRDFVKWKALAVNGLDYRHGHHLRIAGIELEEPYARLIIHEDLSTNINELIVEQDDAPAAEPADAAPPLAIHIDGIKLRDGSANFADFSLRPNFATAIQQLNGDIGALDNQSQQAASVDISGWVDRYAPVSIKGRLTPFDPLHSLDIATSFKQVELTTLTPYSGKFAGYRIRRGRLNLDLHYRIDAGRLNAENHVLLENLQLGERVDSDDAVDLPVRLAVALLKDTQGNIDIALPVTGDLNDPEFSIMPIVWQTLRNLILRAVQAPFKFVAGLVGGGDEDLDRIPFAPGSSALDDTGRQRLDTLAKALRQRPQLRLDVEGASDPARDGPLLAERRLRREYQQLWYNSLQRRGERVPATPDALEIDEDLQASLLGAIYRSQLRQPPAEWSSLGERQVRENMRQALLTHWRDNPAALRRLAQERAAAIKGYLVDVGGLEDARIYLLDATQAAPGAEGAVETLLHLDSQ